MTESKSKTTSKRKPSIKRSIDLDLVKSLDTELKQKLLVFYTNILNQQEEIKRNNLIDKAKEIFNIKNNLLKNIGDNDQQREELLKLVSSFPKDTPTTDKGWSRVIGIMDRGGKSKSKRVVEFPSTPKGTKPKTKNKTVSKRSKTSTNK